MRRFVLLALPIVVAGVAAGATPMFAQSESDELTKKTWRKPGAADLVDAYPDYADFIKRLRALGIQEELIEKLIRGLIRGDLPPITSVEQLRQYLQGSAQSVPPATLSFESGWFSAGQWAKPGITRPLAARDRFECLREAALVPQIPFPMPPPKPPEPPLPNPPTGFGGRLPDFAGGYDRLRVQQEAEAQARRQEWLRNDLYQACMEARGYQWVPAPQPSPRPTP